MPILTVTAPHFQNANLHAQDGLFTLQDEDLSGKLNAEIRREDLPETVTRVLADHHEKWRKDYIWFHQVRLPWRRSIDLMNLLAKEGISAATIYPGYRGVALALQEESR